MDLEFVREVIGKSKKYSEDFEFYKFRKKEYDYIKLKNYDLIITNGNVDDYGDEYIVIDFHVHNDDILTSIAEGKVDFRRGVYRLFSKNTEMLYLIEGLYNKEKDDDVTSLVDFSNSTKDESIIITLDYIIENT